MNLGSGGSTYNAVMYNSPTVSVTDKVVGTAAVEFNASSSQYILIPPFTTGLSGLSIVCWFKFSGSQPFSQIFDFGNDPPGNNNANNNLLFSLDIGDVFIEYWSNSNTEKGMYDIFGYDPNDGAWRHLAWTIDSSGYWLVYVNGDVINSSGELGYPPSITRIYNYLGRSGWAEDPYLSGAIDEFYLFQYCISATQVQGLYNHGRCTPRT